MMKIEIEIPNHFDEEHQKELSIMFKLLCDNLDTDGITCREIPTVEIDVKDKLNIGTGDVQE